jgi:hypothetical protein
MKENRLKIIINKPSNELFAFYINPENTPLWLDFIVKEETNEFPVKMGTVYRNLNTKGKWFEYKVTIFEKNKVFELSSMDRNYHVRYTHFLIDYNTTELEYFEWVDKGELEEPFTMEILQKLKEVMEKKEITHN